ncbi:MAG TPA: hypothetical protein VGL38_12250 [bacterium]|jgi:hypothetical protein
MLFRALLVMLLLYLIARYASKVLRPRDPQRQVKGNPRNRGGAIDQGRIQDATFKDLPDK